jgi:hypothetical protein
MLAAIEAAKQGEHHPAVKSVLEASVPGLLNGAEDAKAYAEAALERHCDSSAYAGIVSASEALFDADPSSVGRVRAVLTSERSFSGATFESCNAAEALLKRIGSDEALLACHRGLVTKALPLYKPLSTAAAISVEDVTVGISELSAA